ncbi:MAG TPA: hypothetical protein ENH60_01505 [Pricia sp.]|nr:hypothetical protein [Pricia sp.]
MTKVLRLSDGKIFSSPRGVAMEADKPIEREVYYCCRGYLEAVNGEKYEWILDDEKDRGRREYDESYWDRRGKWMNRAWVLKWRAMFILEWLDRKYTSGAWLRTGQIANGICEVGKQMSVDYAWKPTAQSLSKHVHTYSAFYTITIGMEERNLSVPGYKGRIFKFTPPTEDIDVDAVLEELADSWDWGRGKPVIRLSDNKRFRSMSEAERVTGIPYYQILHNCESDIAHCIVPLTNEKMEFKYATEVSTEN